MSFWYHPVTNLISQWSHYDIELCIYIHPANTSRSPNVGLMLDQRRRRWTNIKPTLGERLVLAGYRATSIYHIRPSKFCGLYVTTIIFAHTYTHMQGSLSDSQNVSIKLSCYWLLFYTSHVCVFANAQYFLSRNRLWYKNNVSFLPDSTRPINPYAYASDISMVISLRKQEGNNNILLTS